MKVTNVKLTGIINEFLVKVADVHNPRQSEQVSEALKRLLIPENKQPDIIIELNNLLEIKPIRGKEPFVHIMCKDGHGFEVADFWYKDGKLCLYWELKK